MELIISYKSQIYIFQCSFLNNYGAASGGAIYAMHRISLIEIRNCIFHNNYAVRGGAIKIANMHIKRFSYGYWKNIVHNYRDEVMNHTISVVVIQTNLEDNSADFGGAIYVDGAQRNNDGTLSAPNIIIKNCQIKFNAAS